MRAKYEEILQEITEIHKQEKSLLNEKLQSKQTLTFGERSKRNADSETHSTCSMRDEIDKLNLLIEEKDYMNSELKQQIFLLKERISSYHDSWYSGDQSSNETNKEIESLKKEIKSLQDDLNKTEQNYNEQCILYKQKLNDERQRNVEIKEQMTELRDIYDKKVNLLMRQLFDKEDEIINMKSEFRGSWIFERCSSGKPHDVANSNNRESTHNRSQTPTTCLMTHNYENSCSNNHNPLIESTGNSISSSYNLKSFPPVWLENLSDNEYKTLRKYQQLIDNASRIECAKCKALLHPNMFYDHIKDEGKWTNSEIIERCESPVVDKNSSPMSNCKLYPNTESTMNYSNSMNYSLSGSKNDFAYGQLSSRQQVKLLKILDMKYFQRYD